MIYTVTLNPSLDYTMKIENFQTGSLNRSLVEQMVPGGKGINVSTMLRKLGYSSTALGFIAGFTGEEIERRLQMEGIKPEFIWLGEGFSRINVKVLTIGEASHNHTESKEPEIQEETELNGRGPVVEAAALEALLERLGYLQTGDFLVLAGSVPSGLPDTMYQNICARLAGKGIRIVVDASGGLLEGVLPYHPFLVKPNQYELGELFGIELRTREEAIPYARKLQKLGAANVLVSMGGEGAVLAGENGIIYEAAAPKGKVLGTVGAGDSMVAGFLAGFLKTQDYREAFLTGLCAGSASAFSNGLATAEMVEKVRKSLPANA